MDESPAPTRSDRLLMHSLRDEVARLCLSIGSRLNKVTQTECGLCGARNQAIPWQPRNL